MDTTGPFWVRWGRRRIAGWLLGSAALGALTWALAATAQQAAVAAARPEGVDLYTYSLGGHAAAMTLLGCVAVLVSSALLRQRHRVMAAAVLAGTAAGPMALIAAPVRWRLVAPGSMDTVWWWHLAVAAAVFAILAAWTVAVTTAPGEPAPASAGLRAVVSDDAAFLLVAAAGSAWCWNFAWHLQESPGVLPALGWAGLAAGAAIAVARGPWRTGAMLVPLIAAALGVMAWAYLRQGGWPGVAGWEFNGMESPVVLSGRVAAAMAAAPLLGLALRAVCFIANRRGAPPAAARAAVAA